MSLYELCRWAALKDAIDLIGDKCEEKKINFDNFDLEPLKIQKYVDSATDVLYNKVLENETIN
jgi:type VI protein secretion system component Hcp